MDTCKYYEERIISLKSFIKSEVKMAFNFEFVLKIVQIETNHKGFYRVYVIYVSETENMCSTKIISLLEAFILGMDEIR